MADQQRLTVAGPGPDRSSMLDSTWIVTQPEIDKGASADTRLGSFGRGLLRRGRLFVLTVVLLNGAALLGVNQLAPRYTAEADLLVGRQEEQVVDLKAVLSGLTGDSDEIESEIQVLHSRGIARSVVEKFKLDRRPEFNPALRPPGMMKTAADFVAAEYSSLVGPLFHHASAPSTRPARLSVLPLPAENAPNASDLDLLVTPRDPLSIPIDNFTQDLDVMSKGRSRVVGVSFTSTSPVLAAGIANAVADAYIANQLKAKTDATTQAHIWLDQRVTELRRQMIDADNAVVAYRRKHDLVRGLQTSLLTEQLSELGTEVIRAREAVAVAEARQAAMSSINPHALGLRQDVLAATEQEHRLSANLDALREQSGVGNESEIELRALQQEADADRALYDRLLARSKETQIQTGLQQPDARLVSRAEWPQAPSFPKKSMILPAVFIASCLVGVLLVLAVESLDRGFSTVEQLEQTLGMTGLGFVPLLKRRETNGRSPERFVLDTPTSPYAEAIRSLHTGLMMTGIERAPKTILITSALPGEGKTAISLSLARLMASCGKRVVMIDCDLRRSSLSRAFGAQRGAGLSEYLAGNAKLEDLIRQDSLSTTHCLPAGKFVNTSPDLFASPGMRRLLETLAAQYDLVVLDCAPVLAVSDSRHLCRLADQTVFVVRWQDTRREAAAAALRQMVSAGGRIGGLLLSMVDLDQYGRYSTLGVTQRRVGLYLGY